MSGEHGNLLNVTNLRQGCEGAYLHVLGHALAKACRHLGGSCVRWKAALHAEPLASMTIIPGSAAPPEAEVQDLDYRRGNKWFPKAYGLWRVQGGALALLSWTVRLQRGWCTLGADGKDGAKYCRPCGLVQCSHMT